MQSDSNKIIQALILDIIPLFSEHLVQIVQFDSNELSDTNLALLLTDYTPDDYRQVSGQLHSIIEHYSELSAATLSVIAVKYTSIRNHPLADAICSGIVLCKMIQTESPLILIHDKEEGGYTAYYPDLPGCVTCGDTEDEAVRNAFDAKKEWLYSRLKT